MVTAESKLYMFTGAQWGKCELSTLGEIKSKFLQ